MTKREREIVNYIAHVGKANKGLKLIASELHISYGQILRVRMEVMHKNGYYTFESFLADYVREELSRAV